MKQWFGGMLAVSGPVTATVVASPSALDDVRAFAFTFASGFVFFSLFFA